MVDDLRAELRALVRLGCLLAAIAYVHERRAVPSVAGEWAGRIERWVYQQAPLDLP